MNLSEFIKKNLLKIFEALMFIGLIIAVIVLAVRLNKKNDSKSILNSTFFKILLNLKILKI
jgi:hypothetical protein